MKKAIKDVKIGDKVLGTDGKWHKVIGKTDIKIPYKMFEITFSNGKIKCTDTHQWNVFVKWLRLCICQSNITIRFHTDFFN